MSILHNLSWRTRLIALFVLILGTSLLFQLFYVLPTVRNQEAELAKAHQQEIARHIARELDIDLMRIKDRLTRIADRTEFRNMDIVTQQGTMVQHTEISSLVSSLSVMDAEGWSVSSTVDDPFILTTRSSADRPCFTVPFEQGEVYFSSPRFYPEAGLVGTSVSVPIESETGERVGVLLGSMVLNELIENVADYPLQEEQIAFLVDREGTVVAHSGMDLFALEEGPLSLNYDDLLVQAIMAGEEDQPGEHDHDGTPYSGTYAILESNGWGVVVKTPMHAILAGSNILARQLLPVNFGLFIVALAATLVFMRQVTAEQGRAEKALIRAAILGSMSELIVYQDREMRIMWTNKAAGKSAGLAPEQLVGRRCYETWHQRSEPCVGCPVLKTRETGQPQQAEMTTPDGKVWLVRGYPVRDADGDVVGIVEVTLDITERKQAEASLAQRNRELALLNRASQALSATLDLNQVLATVLEEVRHLLDVTASSVWLTDPETNELVCQQVTSPQSELVRGWQLAPGEGIAGWVTQHGESLIVPDIRADERHFKGVDEQTGLPLRAILSTPLRVRQNVIGVLQVVDTEVGRFSTADLTLLEPLAAAAAIAIENARLFGETRQRVAEMEALQHTSLQIASSLDQSLVLDTIVASALALVQASDCHIYFYDEAIETFTFGTALWEDGRREPAVPSLRPDGLTAAVIQESRPIVINSTHRHPLYSAPEAQEWGMQSIAGFPLKRANQMLGVFTIAFLEPHIFSRGELRVLGLLADQAAIAIENARLYEQARQDAETRSTLLREVNHRVKNNLTAIIGLLYAAQSHAKVEDRATYQSAMNELIGRVRGLATAHSMLSASEWAPLRLSDLAAQIIRTSLRALPHDKSVSVDVAISPVRVTPDEAHNLALVINELATNTVKYALGKRDTAQITFQISLDNGTVRCEFRDDGPGYPEDVLQSERHNVGLDLIRNISRDSLRGELSLRNDHGATAIIEFKAKVHNQ